MVLANMLCQAFSAKTSWALIYVVSCRSCVIVCFLPTSNDFQVAADAFANSGLTSIVF
jgi:hypothetical protein